MRTLRKIEEFRKEASNALFTHQQALCVARKLFELELNGDNSPEDMRILQGALQRLDIRYFDATSTEIDAVLDAAGVARLTADNIADAIDVMIFEAT